MSAAGLLGLALALVTNGPGRREAVVLGAAAVSSKPVTIASATTAKPVLVLGAGGGTGRACVAALLAKGIPCVATSRTGDLSFDAAELLTVAAADVTDASALSQFIRPGAFTGVIFAASASAKGGDALAVDRDGVISAARCCISASVPRFVLVSSGAVTRPDSAVYQLLNLVGKGIMKAKIEGEDALRDMYARAPRDAGAYTIVRPGGLTTGDALGPEALELNQGDDKSGRISRADVAGLCVAALSDPAAADTTFECYELETAKPVESVGLSNMLKQRDPTPYTSGRERRGSTYAALFEGLAAQSGTRS